MKQMIDAARNARMVGGSLVNWLEMTAAVTGTLTWEEPPLTCPHIDAVMASGTLSADVAAELAEIREINSQLRYGAWAMKAMLASRVEALAAVTAERDALRKKTGDFPAPPDCRATLDAIKAEIREEHRMAEIKIGRLDPVQHWRRREKQAGVIAALHRALAIIEKHEKENGGG